MLPRRGEGPALSTNSKNSGVDFTGSQEWSSFAKATNLSLCMRKLRHIEKKTGTAAETNPAPQGLVFLQRAAQVLYFSDRLY